MNKNQIDEIMGVPIVFDEHASFVARAVGFGPWKKIVVSKSWGQFTGPIRTAIVMHEIRHCKAGHLEQRALMAILVTAPWLIVLPATFLAAALVSGAFVLLAYLLAKRQEFDADAFAVEHGHGIGMKQFLDYQSRAAPKVSFHPDTDKRIAHVAKLLKEQIHEVAA